MSDADVKRPFRSLIRIYGPVLAMIAIVALVGGVRGLFGDAVGGSGSLFLGELEGDLLGDYKGVLGVAHNAGDRHATTQLALEHNADVIEIDVVSSASTLYAGHSPPPQFAAPVPERPTLSSAWSAASEAPHIMLDLKQSSRSFLIRVASFLHMRPSQGTLVVSRSAPALEFLAEEAPDATLLLSVPSSRSLDGLLEDEELASRIDGVSAFAGVLNESTIERLKEQDLLVFAWVVNTMPKVNELVAAGVDGIITDNLAILRLLGDPENESAEEEGGP